MQSKSPSHANPRAPSRLMAAPLQSRPPEAGALPLRETRGKEAPFPFPPGASRGGESSPPRRQHRSAPPARGFSKRSAENPLARSPCGHDGESVQSETMRAAKQEADVFPLAALCLLAENSHRGHRLSTAVLHQGFAPINSSTATSFQAFLYDEGRRSRSTGKERDAETGLDYFGARYFSAAQGRFTSPDWSTNPQPAPYASLTDPQTLNLYGYVRNSPMARADADGHCFWDLCIGEGIATYAAATAVVATAAYLMTPQGKESLRAAVVGTGALINKAAEGVQSLITKSEAKPGTLGKPDHQQTVQEEAAKIGGKPEVTIKTPGGTKDARRADAAKKDAAGNITDVTQVYRPTPAGNIPKREVDAARDIENATGVKPTMVPVRPVTPPKPNSEVE